MIFRWIGAGLRDCWLFLRCCTILNYLFRNRQDACSTRKFTLCGTGILPVLENGARCELFTIIICETRPYNLMDSEIGSATAARSGSTASRCASKSARFLMFDL